MAMIDRDGEFDRFLAQSLGAPARVPDAGFVARVEQQILLDERQRRARAQMAERLGVELLSIIAVGCALLAAGAGVDIADSAGHLPAVALAGLVLMFGAWVTLVSAQQSNPSLS